MGDILLKGAQHGAQFHPQDTEPTAGYTTKSVAHDQCDARPSMGNTVQ